MLRNDPQRLMRRYATPGTSAAYGDVNFAQLLAAYNNRQPIIKGMPGSAGEGASEYYTPNAAVLNGYAIQPFGGYDSQGTYNNPNMFAVFKDLPEGTSPEALNGTPFDIYTNNGQYVGTHNWQNISGETGLDKFWNTAIPLLTTAFIGGGLAGAAGYGPMAGGGTTPTGLETVSEGFGPGFEASLSNGGWDVLPEAVSGGTSAMGAGGGFGSVGQVVSGGSGATTGLGSSVAGGTGGYNIPGLGASLSTTSTPNNLANLLKTIGLTGGGGSGFSWGSLVGPAASLLGGYMSSKASGKAADAQLQAAREAAAMSKPWTDAGGWAIGQGANMLGKNGPEAAKAAFMQSPDYQFRRDEGEKALTRAAAAAGLRGSGKFLKDYNRFNQDLASTEFGNSFNRLMSVAGMGQTATGNRADYATQAANATAAGAVGKANAWTNALTQGASMYNNYQQQQQNNALMAAILAGRA